MSMGIDPSETQVQQLLDSLAVHSGPTQQEMILQIRQEMERSGRVKDWLSQREQSFGAMIEHLPDALARFDRQLRIVYANSAIEGLAGRGAEQCIGRTLREIGWPGDLCEKWEARLREVFDSGREAAFEYEFTGGSSKAKQQTYEARLVPEGDASGGQVHFVLSVNRIASGREALREERDRLDLALDAGQAGMVLWDMRANKAWWNAYAYRIHGYPPDSFEPTYELWLSRIHPDDRKGVDEQFRACISQRRSELVCEYRVVRPSGDTRWVRGIGRFRFDANGTAESFSGIASDVTEQKQFEQSLRESDATLRCLKEANIIGIIQGEERRITDANDIFLRMLGYGRQEFATRQCLYTDITPPEYASLDEQAMRELSAGRAARPFEKEYLRKDGGRVPVLLGVARIGETPLRWICFVMDMSEQKRVAAERSKLAALVQNSGDFIGLAEVDGRSLFLNAAGRRLVGLDLEGPLPPVGEYLFPEDTAFYMREVLPKMLQEGHWVGEFRFRHFKTQEPIDVLWDCFCIKDPQTGRPVCIATVTRDIREQKRAQAAVQRSKEALEQASRAKDQFIATLSHELRTPLTPVLTAVQMMERDPTLRPELRDEMQMVHRNLSLEVRLIDDLLDLARIGRGKLELHLETVDLHAMLRRVADICDSDLRSKQLQLVVDLDAEQHHVVGDATRLQQVVWNLLKNAIKFTPAGGKITLRAEQAAENRVAVTISDTGIGIEPAVLSRIFDAFEQGDRETTRHFGGLGLGLAISKGIIDMHGGTLTASSRGKGFGASFRVELATASAPQVETSHGERARGEHAAGRSGRLLIVEDHADTRTLMARLLRILGYEVRTADSVAGALLAAGEQEFDVVLCDIGLPDGSGLDLMRQLTASKGPIRAIALSGFGMEEDIRQSREAGFVEHLTKPVDVNQLEEVVDRILRGDEEALRR